MTAQSVVIKLKSLSQVTASPEKYKLVPVTTKKTSDQWPALSEGLINTPQGSTDLMVFERRPQPDDLDI
jgi:hypothetical protein